MVRSTHFKPTILVTDAGRGSAVAIIRSLGRRGWTVIAADDCANSPGLRSRYAAGRVVYAPPETAPAQFVETIKSAVRKHRIDLVIPVTDPAILRIAEARSDFEGLCALSIPSITALDTVCNKHSTIELAGRLGVPVPRTVVVSGVNEAVAAARDFSWPVVLKPQVSRLHNGALIEKLLVSYAEDAEALTQTMRRFEGRCPVLLQEFCAGEGQGVELLMHEGRPLAAFQHRRLREMPVQGGPSALRESVSLDPILYEHSVNMLREIRWTGLAMVEFKVSPAAAWLMEINGRVWGSLPLAVHAGIDFPARLVELLLHAGNEGDSVSPSSYRTGVRSHNLELELGWIASVLMGRHRSPSLPFPPRRECLSALLQLFHPAYKQDMLSLNDPIPGLLDILRILKRGVSRFVRRQPGLEPCLPT
jgi:predicted ATP-grasp superfamily ATP-dependent carboligase